MKLLNAQMSLSEFIKELQGLEDKGFGRRRMYFYCNHCGSDYKIKDTLEVGAARLCDGMGELRVVITLDI